MQQTVDDILRAWIHHDTRDTPKFEVIRRIEDRNVEEVGYVGLASVFCCPFLGAIKTLLVLHNGCKIA